MGTMVLFSRSQFIKINTESEGKLAPFLLRSPLAIVGGEHLKQKYQYKFIETKHGSPVVQHNAQNDPLNFVQNNT